MGQMCHHFNWTLDYLLEGVDWRVAQRMMIDAPTYDTNKDDDKEKSEKPKVKEINLKELNADDLLSQVSEIFGNE